jgi:Flp pilus assembly protein TadG
VTAVPAPQIIRRLTRGAHRFAAASEGNIAVMFAIAVLPILAFVGAAIDYSRAANARGSMQAALDSTSLMLSKDLSIGTITQAQISTKAISYFNALYTNRDAQGVSITATYTPGSGSTGNTVQVNGTGSITTDFMRVAGFPTMGYGATSTSTWGTSLLRVALVLDTTGSMADYNKIGNLQTAAKSLVTQLSNLVVNTGDVYISVVPFAIDVDVNSSNSGASWLRWDMYDTQTTYSDRNGTHSYCSGGDPKYGGPYYWYPTWAQCTGHGYVWNHSTPSTSKSQWNGCVGDRDQNNDVSSTAPSSTATNFIADQDSSCPDAVVTPLTYTWSTVNNTINAMSPGGATNQTIGLQWGWLSLLQRSPLNAPSEDATKQYQHIIILFTDGLNTADRTYGNGSDASTQVDSRMTALCTNIKATGVQIYTVQIDTDGAGQSAVLPACASSTNNFFMLTQPSQIAAAFAQIGTDIAKLRVAR